MNIDLDPFGDHPPLYSAADLSLAEREAAREERSRIRQTALSWIAQIEEDGLSGFQHQAEVLRDFAALLEDC